jgi:AraC-like DNA-binding protein
LFRYSHRKFQNLTMTVAEPRQMDNTFGFSAWRGIPAVMAEPHAHNDIELNICATELVYRSAGTVRTLPAGVPCAFWGAKPHQLIRADREQALGYVTIPLSQFMSWGLPGAVKDRLLHGDVLVGPPDSAPPELPAQIERWARETAGDDPLILRAAALEIESLLSRMSRGAWAEASVAAPAAQSGRDVDRATRMAAFIAQNSTLDIRVADVAAVVHVHPNRASSIFRSVLGTTVNDYLGQFRVAEAQRLLLTTDLSSAAVAARAGFQSLSTYHETFDSICGLSPTRWRREHAGDHAEGASP